VWERLNSVELISGPARVPLYDTSKHGTGIVHIGIGAFHRAHQAVMTDDAIAANGGDWRIVGVSLRSKDLAQCLNEQNGLYTLIERARAGIRSRIIGSIDRVIAADPDATLQALSNPNIRVVTLTVTEKGYGINRTSGMPDPTDPVVATDLACPQTPSGVLGLLVEALRRRRTNGHPALTILSCDNLPNNGELLRRGTIGFARSIGNDDLAEWIDQNIAFPSSMVDRITPAATKETLVEASRQTGCDDRAAIETEPFVQWVIEDKFVSGRPKWEAGGAVFVDDVAPYEHMKLTMLNGAHSMMAYAGFLLGRKYVRDVMAHADLATLVERHLTSAAALLAPLPGIDFGDYGVALIDRFANPTIAHETYQIASDGSQKMPQRVFEPALNALASDQTVRPFAFATAMWMRFCIGRTDRGDAYEIRDPRSDELNQAASLPGRNAVEIIAAFNELPSLIPRALKSNKKWNTELESALSDILLSGAAEATRIEALSN